MTGEIINLRKFRKDKARADKDKIADQNRAKFGMSKAEKQTLKSEQDKIARVLDGAQLNPKKDEAE